MSSAGPWDDIDDAPTVQQDTTRTIDIEMLRRAGDQRAANEAALGLPPPRPVVATYIPALPPSPPQPVYVLGYPTHVGPDATPLPTSRSSLPARRRGTDLHRVARILAGVAAGLAIALCIVLLVPRRGDLRVEVRGGDDARAEIFIDGIKRCDAAPCIVRDLRPGARTVQVFASGLEAKAVTEVIAAGEQRVAVVSLKPTSPESPLVAAAPPPIQTTPEALDVIVPSPTPAIAAPAPAPAPRRAAAPPAIAARPSPPPQSPAPPPAAAESGSGTLHVNSMPASKVMLDGSPLGETPRAGVAVSAGKHTVTFVHRELGRKSVTVTVRPGEAATASVRFKP